MTALEIQNVRTRPEWAEIINDDWRKSIEGIIQTGRDLIAAKGELPRGEFHKMIDADLPFGQTATRAFMRIARSKAITNRRPGDGLPQGYVVLGQLASLSAEDFQDARERGLIGVETSKKKAVAVRRAYKGSADGAVGEGAEVSGLPSPKEAREVARATNRMVAASDGNLYSGATEEEGAEYVRRREQTYAVIDAIKAISESGALADTARFQQRQSPTSGFQVVQVPRSGRGHQRGLQGARWAVQGTPGIWLGLGILWRTGVAHADADSRVGWPHGREGGAKEAQVGRPGRVAREGRRRSVRRPSC